jgi:hypothetical protein
VSASRKEVRISADSESKTITVRYRELKWYSPNGPWRQVTFPARDFEKALAEAKIAVPWSMVSR